MYLWGCLGCGMRKVEEKSFRGKKKGILEMGPELFVWLLFVIVGWLMFLMMIY